MAEFKMDSAYTQRFGELVEIDAVNSAWISGDLPTMLSVLDVKTNLIDRHFLLSSIVKETYKRRENPEMRKKCREIAELHIREFPTVRPAFIENFFGHGRPDENTQHEWAEKNIHVSTFEHYATVLTEDGEYEKAIEVCNLAIAYKVIDGTKSGFAGRIERIKKKMGK